MSDTATQILQYRGVAIQGLLARREVTIDLPRLVVPQLEESTPPKETDRSVSTLVSDGIAQVLGLCRSVREEIHAGIIRRFVLINRGLAEAELDRLKKVLSSSLIVPTAKQIEAARPRGLHLPYSEFGNGGFLFNPFPVEPDGED